MHVYNGYPISTPPNHISSNATKRAVAHSLGQRWGPLIAARRDEMQMSQAAVARRCGVSQQTISKIERGLMVPLDPLKLRLADALAVWPGEIFPW